jgi:hypothetical protein
VHIGFHRAQFRGTRGRDYVIAGLTWHASILATLLRAKLPHLSCNHRGIHTRPINAST